MRMDHVIVTAHRLGLDHTPVGKLLLMKLKLYGRQEDRRLLERLITKTVEEGFTQAYDFRQPFRPSIQQGIAGDVYPYTAVDGGFDVGLSLEALTMGFAAYGKVGVGKSTALYRVIDPIIGLGYPCVVFSQKNDGFFEQLAHTHPSVSCYRLGVDRDVFNPFALEAGTLARIFEHVFWRKDSVTILMAALDQHQRQHGIPTLMGLMTILDSLSLPGRALVNPDLKKSIYASLIQLAKDPLQVSIDTPKGSAIDAFASGKSLVINTSALSPNAELFFMSCFIAALRRVVQANAGFQGAVVIDEATQIVAKQGVNASPLATEVRLMRGSGLSLIIGAHNPGIVDPTIRASNHITAVMNLTDRQDIEAAAKSCALSQEQTKAISHLPRGVAIFKQASGFTNPFLVTWKPVALAQPMTPPVAVPPAVSVAAPPPVSADDLRGRFLVDIADSPCCGLAQRSKRMGVTWRKGKEILQELSDEGLATTLRVQVGKRGQPPEWAFLTDEGYQVCKRAKPTTRGGTGIAHAIIQGWVKEQVEALGYQAEIECFREGKSVDIGIPSLGVAIEVVISTSRNEPHQAELDLLQWKRVVVLCPNKDVLSSATKSFSRSAVDMSRVQLCLPKDLQEALSE